MDPFFPFPCPCPDELQLWDPPMDPSFDFPAAVAGIIPLPQSPPARPSAFSSFAGPSTSLRSPNSRPRPLSSPNIHRRVISLMRSIHGRNQASRDGGENGGGRREGTRGFRHMMRERQRRERLSQSYADLYSMLPPRTKADKNSIVQAATAVVREMKGAREGLRNRNEELVRRAAALAAEAKPGIDRKVGAASKGVIAFRSVDPTLSAIDSVIAALSCFDGMDAKAEAIRLEFASGTSGLMTTFVTVEGDQVLENNSIWLV